MSNLFSICSNEDYTNGNHNGLNSSTASSYCKSQLSTSPPAWSRAWNSTTSTTPRTQLPVAWISTTSKQPGTQLPVAWNSTTSSLELNYQQPGTQLPVAWNLCIWNSKFMIAAASLLLDKLFSCLCIHSSVIDLAQLLSDARRSLHHRECHLQY